VAITFIVEDGTGVTGATTYLDLAAAQDLADTFGLTWPVAVDDQQIALNKGAAFLERYKYKGVKLTCTQGLKWPRSDVYVDCCLIASDSVPSDIKEAQIYAAAYSASAELRATSSGQSVASEKVDVLEVSYHDNGKSNAVVSIPEVTDRLSQYIGGGNRATRV
jgi:hypothetical protein